MVSGEELRETVRLHLNFESLPEDHAHKLINFHMGLAASYVANIDYFKDLLQTIYLSSDKDGIFTVPRRILPHQAYSDGDIDGRNWRRMIPMEYNLFELQNTSTNYYYPQHSYFSGFLGSYNRRYTVLPSQKPDKTIMRLLDPYLPDTQSEDCSKKVRNIKLIYYPIIPAIDEFPEEFIPILLTETLISLAPHTKLQSGTTYLESLRRQCKEMKFKLKNTANRIETTYNPQQHNDLTQAFLMGHLSDITVWGYPQ